MRVSVLFVWGGKGWQLFGLCVVARCTHQVGLSQHLVQSLHDLHCWVYNHDTHKQERERHAGMCQSRQHEPACDHFCVQLPTVELRSSHPDSGGDFVDGAAATAACDAMIKPPTLLPATCVCLQQDDTPRLYCREFDGVLM